MVITPAALLASLLAMTLVTGAQARHRPKKHPPMRFTATAYCDRGTTQSGTQARRGIIAADPRVLPMGSVVRIAGTGVRAADYIVSDTGSAVKGRRLDIFMPSCAAAKRFGRRPVTAQLIKAAAAADRPNP